MGELIDLRMVFEEKRMIDATVRIERCSTELLVKALGQPGRSTEAARPPGQLIRLAQRHKFGPAH